MTEGEGKIFEVINKITGGKVTREEASQILKEVKANQARLNACEGPHDFQPMGPTDKLRQRYRCSKCQGEVESLARTWYEDGLRHARKELDK
jgi:transposase-like protein